MKILVDCHSFDKELYQGANTYIIGVYEELIKIAPREWEFVLYSVNSDYLRDVFAGYENLTFYTPKYSSTLYRFVYGLSKAVLDVKADYLHVTYKSPLLKLSKEWVTVHDVLFVDYPQHFPVIFRKLSYLLYKRSVKRADFVNTISDYSKERVEHIFGVENVHNTGMGLPMLQREESMSDRKDINEVARSKFILCVSRIEPRKNQEYLLEIFGEMKSECKLVFVGSLTHSYPGFESLIENFEGSSVFWFQKLSYTDLRRLYSKAHLTVYPSICEGFGLPPLESLLYDTPVVFNPNTAMSEYKEVSLFELAWDDAKGMARKLDDVLMKPKSEVNTSFLKEVYVWQEVARKIIQKLV